MVKFIRDTISSLRKPYVPPKSVEIAGRSLGRIAEEISRNVPDPPSRSVRNGGRYPDPPRRNRK